MDKLKCNPLACLSVFLVIMGLMFGFTTTAVNSMDQKITRIYEILINSRNYADIAPASKIYAQAHPAPA